jgi:hypothetical protein
MNPGTEVSTEYRWPYDAAHPDCWQEPWKGILLAPNDPRAWQNTVRFPGRLPEQAEVDQHLADLHQRDTPLTAVPVLYDFDGEASVQWETPDKVVPYHQCLLHWRVVRAVKRDTYKPVFRVNERSDGFEVKHVPKGQTHWMGDGVDTLSSEDGQAWKPGTPGFCEAWEFILNEDAATTYEGCFPDLDPDAYDDPVLD